MGKKGNMTTNIIVGLLIAIIVLFLVVRIFGGNLEKSSNDFKACTTKGGMCMDGCSTGFVEIGECTGSGKEQVCCVRFSDNS